MLYQLKMEAHNVAGSTNADFTFVTLTKDGGGCPLFFVAAGSSAQTFHPHRSATRGNGESYKSEQVLPQRENHHHRHHHRHNRDMFQRNNDYLFETT